MIPLYSAQQVRSADKHAINKLYFPGEILMENAAISIVDAILEHYPYIDSDYKFGIICGKGNNGGDGFAVARQLLIKGFTVIVISIGKEKELSSDALTNYKIYKKLILEYDNGSLIHFETIRDINKIENCEIIVDGILGTGFSSKLKNPYDHIIKKLNIIPALKISIDSPSGLDLNTGTGDIIFNSNLTVTLAALKTGLFYEKGRVNAGKIKHGSIGIGKNYFTSLDTKDFLVEPEDVVESLPKKKINANKYTSGKVFAIAGSADLPNAAVYSINAAMISGCGAGLLAAPNSIKSLVQTQMNSAVVADYQDNEDGFLKTENILEINKNIIWADAVIIGPGLGRNLDTQGAVFEILKKYPEKSFIIDADAINALKNKKYRKLNLSNSVFTPHHKEFADLLGISVSDLESNLLKHGRKFAGETGAVLVLKGSPTIIFNSEGEVFINTSGNQGLAKFGSGDVLTGILASLVAQQGDIEKSSLASVFLHGLTADLIVKNESEFAIIPQKLIDQFSATVKFLRKSIV